jgi:chemotaxis response regulator CheB
MGQDGVKGCEALAARAGLAEKILPLDQLAPEIVRCVSNQAAFVRVN